MFLLDDNQIIAGKIGVIGIIVEIMKTHIGNADVCNNGCEAIWSITINGK